MLCSLNEEKYLNMTAIPPQSHLSVLVLQSGCCKWSGVSRYVCTLSVCRPGQARQRGTSAQPCCSCWQHAVRVALETQPQLAAAASLSMCSTTEILACGTYLPASYRWDLTQQFSIWLASLQRFKKICLCCMQCILCISIVAVLHSL